MGSPVPVGIFTHAQKVCRLYKKALRNLESWHNLFTDFRYDAVVLRARFDANKNIKDLRVAKELLLKGEQELWELEHPAPMRFPESYGGCAYEREVIPPDWVVDYWHPTEKAMYPKYFALREKRKKEYYKFYDKQYPNAQKHFESPPDY